MEMVPYAYEKVEVRNSVQRYISSNYVILSKFHNNISNKQLEQNIGICLSLLGN